MSRTQDLEAQLSEALDYLDEAEEALTILWQANVRLNAELSMIRDGRAFMPESKTVN